MLSSSPGFLISLGETRGRDLIIVSLFAGVSDIAPRNPGCRDATACFSAASASAEGSGTEEVAVIIGRDEEKEEEA